MTQNASLSIGVILLALFLFAIVLIVLRSHKQIALRSMPAFRVLNRIIGRAVEEGSALHISLGSGSLLGRQSTIGFTGLTALDNLSRISQIGDKKAICTSGDGGLIILSQDILRHVFQQAPKLGIYQGQQTKLSGATPSAYVIGTMIAMLDAPVAGSLLIGSFDSIAVLLTSHPFSSQLSLTAADTLQAQAAFYACSNESLVGEEIYAVGAYSGANRTSTAGLITQDVLRWLIISFISISIILRMLGVI